MLAFLVEIQREYYAGMIRHLQELGVRIPSPAPTGPPAARLMAAQRAADFTDGHTYWYEWGVWRPTEKRFPKPQHARRARSVVPRPTFCRFLDRPFFVPGRSLAQRMARRKPALPRRRRRIAGVGEVPYLPLRLPGTRDQLPRPSPPMRWPAYRTAAVCLTRSTIPPSLDFYHAALILRRGDVRESDAPAEVVLPDLPDPMGACAGARFILAPAMSRRWRRGSPQGRHPFCRQSGCTAASAPDQPLVPETCGNWFPIPASYLQSRPALCHD